MKVFGVIAVMAMVAGAFIAPGLAVAGGTSSCTGANRTACEVVRYNAGRDTSRGKIGRFADYCDTVLRRTGEPLVFRFAYGNNAWAKDSLPLPGLVWAGKNKASERFRRLGISFGDGKVVVETKLCVDRSVWRRALAKAGVSRNDIASGKITIFLCGGRWAQRVPKVRILAILSGKRLTRGGSYSVLSRRETQKMVAELTRRGY